MRGRAKMRHLKRIWEQVAEHRLWFLLLLFTDLVFILFLWLMDREGFFVLAGLMTFLILLFFFIALFYHCRREVKRENKVADFLQQPDKEQKERACKAVCAREQRQIHEVYRILNEKDRFLKEQMMYREDYEEYVESWVHEIKTPLSLMTLMLDNRKDEMSPAVYERMEYARNQMQGYVEQMLYYARLKAVHKNYVFEPADLASCCREVLEEFQAFLGEKNICICSEVPEIKVLTDKKSFIFMLGQVISNSVKYKDPQKEKSYIWLSATEECRDEKSKSGKIILKIRDNGIGVKACDLPFIFEKGFTGDTDGNQKKSTGMGLYLVGQLAAELNIEVEADSEYRGGFELQFYFPKCK